MGCKLFVVVLLGMSENLIKVSLVSGRDGVPKVALGSVVEAVDQINAEGGDIKGLVSQCFELAKESIKVG